MTVCIAARCLERNSFVLAGDRLFSYGPDSLDSMSLKRVQLTPDNRWKTMFAASPVSNVMPIIRQARHLLATGNFAPPYDLAAIRAVCVRAYQHQREKLVNETILSKYATNLVRWQVEALNFGEAEVARINRLIEDVDVGVELIVFGYDSRNVAHMFTVAEPGTSVDRDQEGLVTAGSGGGYAQQSLISRELLLVSQAEMMCRVLEAKFAAEQDDGVGPDSCAGIVNEPLDPQSEAPERFLRNPEMLAVRKAVLDGQIEPFPRDVVELVKEAIGSSLTSEQIDHVVNKLMNRAAKQRS